MGTLDQTLVSVHPVTQEMLTVLEHLFTYSSGFRLIRAPGACFHGERISVQVLHKNRGVTSGKKRPFGGNAQPWQKFAVSECSCFSLNLQPLQAHICSLDIEKNSPKAFMRNIEQ